MKIFLSFASAVAIAATATVAHAQEPGAPDQKASAPSKGWYASISAGGTWPTDPNYIFSGNGTAYDSSNNAIDWTTDSTGQFGMTGGFSTEAAIGYKFGNQFRGEISYVYNRIGVENGTTNGITTSGDSFTGTYSTSGSFATNSIFANVYYDFPTKSKFVPYVGLGLGWTGTSIDTGGYGYAVNSGGSAYTGSGTATGISLSSLGYQAKVGISYNYSSTSSLFVEGAYQGSSGASAYNPEGLNYLSAINSFGVRAGFRYQFSK